MNAVDFHSISVTYPSQRIPSLKEWLLRGGRARGEDIHALRDVTFSVTAGDSFGIIGGNGAGKSTLVRVAAGIIPPSGGEATTRGVVAPIIELGTGFEGELSGRENIFFNGALLGRSRAFMKRVIDEIIDFADIGAEFIDAPLRTYSTGMVARIAFAIATTIEADIVLLDEVLAVGDVRFRERCYERIRQFHASGATIVLVSHDMHAVEDLCSRAAWLDHGRLRATGTSHDVIDAYTRATQKRGPEALVRA
ncbi:MAG TPA: ABC transporter ATP-binding protein [Thermoanaerobaculia bacterium]|nr:ABC transporter ATP-binding protein [Thermoanaerobaculia bacterium]